MEETKQIVEKSQPYTFEISTNAKGQHQWTLSYQGDNPDEMIATLERIDDRLAKKYENERDQK